MTSSKIQNSGKLDHIQTTCQMFPSTTEPYKTMSKVKMGLRHSALSSAAAPRVQGNTKSNYLS